MNRSNNKSNHHDRDQAGSNRDASDDRLDALLLLADPPKIDGPRKRRLKKHLSGVLSQRRPALAVRAEIVQGVIGAAAVCGIILLVTFVSNLNRSTLMPPVAMDHVSTATSPPETVEPVASRQIISYVVWTPVEHRKPGPVGVFLRNRFIELDHQLNRIADSEFGLTLLEQATYALESEKAHANRSRDTQQNVLALERLRERFETTLVDTIRSNQSSLKQKSLAFRQLCRCGSTRTLNLVLSYWGNEELEPDILISAKRLAGAATLGQMIASTTDDEFKTELMVELLERGDDASVLLFLELTDRFQIYSIARESGSRARHIPTEKLLAAVECNRLGIVRSASIALSYVDDPIITERLLEIAGSPSTQHAAVLALTARQDDRAMRFVELAIGDLRWSATVAMAQRKWNQILVVN